MAENKDTWFENTAVCIDDFSYPRLKLGEVYIVKDIDIESETVIIEIDGYQDYPINFFQINIVDKRTVGGIKEVDKDISELEDEIEWLEDEISSKRGELEILQRKKQLLLRGNICNR